MTTHITVFYHRNCPDGATAAWIARDSLATQGRTYHMVPLEAGRGITDFARIAGHDVLCLDVCPPQADLERVAAVAATLRVLDHHVTNSAIAAALPDHVTVDTSASGALLAWRHFHPGIDAPDLVRHVDELDRYRQDLPGWRPMQALLRGCGNPERIAKLATALAADLPGTLERGETLANSRAREVDGYQVAARRAWLGDTPVLAVELGMQAGDLASDVGNHVAAQHGAIAVVWRFKEGLYRYSLRTEPGPASAIRRQGLPIDALAVAHGGGGHPHAAGFVSKVQVLRFAPDYAPALAVAIEAARAAGVLLRDEMARPGGPRGLLDHADIDNVAEASIRERLTAAFPDHAILGEENGRTQGGPDQPHLWLVDPNDGTRAYLHGARGPAVSIALLHAGEPVLGVVYAFAAPDHDGDLFSWAQGCGPLLRNGQPVAAPEWPETLKPHDIVLVSPAADYYVEPNSRLVAPARFLGVPSIAWRLARAAAGDGVVAVSLNGPTGWDMAAGHALLLASGGVLLDQDGNPVRYDAQGHCRTTAVFGGGLAACRALAARSWRELHRATPDHGAPRIRPVLGEVVADAGLLARAQGCLLGMIAGDSLGSLVEFRSAADIARGHPDGVRDLADGGTWGTLAGQPTDDSEMALALASSLLDAPADPQEVAAQAYGQWFRSKPFDLGQTTRQALSAVTEEKIRSGHAAQAASEAANHDSQANGALMRIAPLAIWGHALAPPELLEHARADARITHPHPVCQDASAVFVAAIAFAIREGALPAAVHAHALAVATAQAMQPAVIDALVQAKGARPADFQTHQGWVLIALQEAFFQLLHSDGPEAGVIATVAAGGDTDTNAAIAGALLGAVHGRNAVPERWRRLVLTCRPLPATRRSRPPIYWPVDAMILAERLLGASSKRPATSW